MEFFVWFAPALPYLQWLVVGIAAVLGFLLKVYHKKQRKQEADIEKTRQRLLEIEVESKREISELKDRLRTLELTSVTERYLNAQMKEMTENLERKFTSNIQELKNDLKDFMREMFHKE